MKKKSFCAGVMLAAVLLIGTGCSVFAPSSEMVKITTRPADAIVLINSRQYNGTPVVLPVNCKRDLYIIAYMPDRPDTQRNYILRRELSFTGVLDTVGFVAILPMFGLITGGAWDFVENDVFIDLNDTTSNLVPLTPAEAMK